MGADYQFVIEGLLLGWSQIITDSSQDLETNGIALYREKLVANLTFNEIGFVFGEDITWAFGIGTMNTGELKLHLDYKTFLEGPRCKR